jgi:hypothetical protein
MHLRGRRAALHLCPDCLKKYCNVQYNSARLIRRDCLDILPDFMYVFLEEEDAIELHICLLDYASVPAEDNPVFWLRKEELSILDWLLFLAHVSECKRAVTVFSEIEKSILMLYNPKTVPVAGRLEEDILMGLKSKRRTPAQNMEEVLRSLTREVYKQNLKTFALLYTKTLGFDKMPVINLFLHVPPVPDALADSLLGVYTTPLNVQRDIQFLMTEHKADIRI